MATNRSRVPSKAPAARMAAREILIWTTRDGREIPLDDMSDDHVANALRVLSLWRRRLRASERERDGTGAEKPAILRDLADAIAMFKRLQRKRLKANTANSKATKSLVLSKRYSSSPLPSPGRGLRRKPVAST